MSRRNRRRVLAGAVAAAALLAAKAPPPPRPLPPTGTIPLFQSRTRIMVMVQVGDGETLPMNFDTGSDGNSFDRLVVRHNALRRVGTVEEVDGSTGKRRTLPRVAMPGARVGGLTVGTIEGAALDYDRSDGMGIISPEVFAGRLVTVDLAASEVRILADDDPAWPAGAPTPYTGGLPAAEVVLPDGTRTTANFDTGFDGPISLPPEMMKTLPLKAPARVVGRFKSINAEGEVYGATVDGVIRIGPLVLRDPAVTFIYGPVNIGLPLMRRLRLTLDPARKQAWVACAGGVTAC